MSRTETKHEYIMRLLADDALADKAAFATPGNMILNKRAIDSYRARMRAELEKKP